MTGPGRILAVDYGKRRVGLAISDPTGSIAFPLKTIDRRLNPQPIEEQVSSVISQHDVQRVVVGLPLTANGERGARSREVEAFASKLRLVAGCEILQWDERFSTARAIRVVHEMGERTGRDKGKLDRISAVFILQNYLDSLTNSSS